MSLSALAIQRRLTAAFIAINPVTIELAAMTETRSTSGATKAVRERKRLPVTVTLCEPSDSGYRSPVADEKGIRQAFDFEMVAPWDTDLREGDLFDLGGVEYRVDVRMIDNGYEARGLVTRVG